jgi:tetratricopeptide (TPR) repeat protein
MLLNPKKDALSDLDKAINLDNYYAEAYMERGLYFIRKHNLKSAKSDLEQAAQINPGSPLIQINLARVLLDLGDNETALVAAQQANTADITMLDGYLVLGMAYRANGQIDKAVEELNTYVKYSPNSSEAFMVLGAAYYNRQDYPTALKNLEQAIRLDSKSSEAFYWRGQTYLATKEYDKALESFHRAVDYNSTSFEAEFGVVQAYNAMNQPRNAYVALNKLEILCDTDPERVILYSYRARSLEEINEVDAAYNDWRRLLDLPAEAVSAELRAEAEARLAVLRTSTPLPLAATFSPTPPATATRFPTATFTSPPATRTPKVSPTPPTPTSTP